METNEDITLPLQRKPLPVYDRDSSSQLLTEDRSPTEPVLFPEEELTIEDPHGGASSRKLRRARGQYQKDLFQRTSSPMPTAGRLSTMRLEVFTNENLQLKEGLINGKKSRRLIIRSIVTNQIESSTAGHDRDCYGGNFYKRGSYINGGS